MNLAESERPVYTHPCAFNKFSELPSGIRQLTSSSPIILGDYEFCLKLYPGGRNEECEGYVSIFLDLHKPSRAHIEWDCSIMLDTRIYSCKRKHNIPFDLKQGRHSYGWNRLIRRTTLSDDVLAFTNDQLVILTKFLDLEAPPSIYHSKRLLSYGKYLNNEELSDVKIIARGETIFAHKIVLISENEVFAAMFKHDLKESKENLIQIEDFEFDVVLELVRFIYVGRVCNIEKMPKKLLIAADKYGVNELKLQCENYLCQLFSVDNVLDYLNFAVQYRADKLKTEAMNFFTAHRKDIAETPEFEITLKTMDADLVTQIVTKLCKS